jgi:hypothetical protein
VITLRTFVAVVFPELDIINATCSEPGNMRALLSRPQYVRFHITTTFYFSVASRVEALLDARNCCS